MVKLNSSSVFVRDPIDAWGKELSIGPAEQAIRTQLPYVFHRGGNVLYWDNFESPTIKPILECGGGGSCARSSTYAQFGDFSMKFTTGATSGNYCMLRYYMSHFREGKVGVTAAVWGGSFGAANWRLGIAYFDGTTEHSGTVKLDRSNDKVYYLDTGLVYQEASTVSFYDSASFPYFTPIKLVIDIENDVYDAAYVSWDKIDLSSHDLYTVSSSLKRHLELSVFYSTDENVDHTVYVDNVIITDMEA